jgi:hypothetical protein
VPVLTHQPSCWYFTLSKAFFRSQEETICIQFDDFIAQYRKAWGIDVLDKVKTEQELRLVWDEFVEGLNINADLEDCYNIRGIPGVADEFVILREFCSCHDPAVDAEWEIDNYIDYIKNNPEEFFRVFKQYEDRVSNTAVRSTWGPVSGKYFTGIVNGIPVPDYTSALYSCKEKLISLCVAPTSKARQSLLSAFPCSETYFTTIFSRHIAAYFGEWVPELDKPDSIYEPMRPLVSSWDSLVPRPTRSFAIGDRHGRTTPCLIPGCGGWSNSRLNTYATKEEVKEAKTPKQKKDLAVFITVQKSEEKLKRDSEERREKRKQKIRTAKEKREDALRKEQLAKAKRAEAAERALEALNIDFIGKSHDLLLEEITEKIANLRPYRVNITRLKNIKNYFSLNTKEAQEKLDTLVLNLESYFAGKQQGENL